MHHPGHQKEDTEVAKENNLANQAMKEIAKGTFIMPLVPVLDLSQFEPEYSTADLENAKSLDLEPPILHHGSQFLKFLKTCVPEEQS